MISQGGILKDLPLNPCAVPFYPPLVYLSVPRMPVKKEEARTKNMRYSPQDMMSLKNRPECKRRPKLLDPSLHFLFETKPTSYGSPVSPQVSNLAPGEKRSYVNTKLYKINQTTNEIESKNTTQPYFRKGTIWNPQKAQPNILRAAEPTILPTLSPLRPRFYPSRPAHPVEAMKQLKEMPTATSPIHQINPQLTTGPKLAPKPKSPIEVIQKQQTPVAAPTPKVPPQIKQLKARFIPSRPVSAIEAMSQLQNYVPGLAPNGHGKHRFF